MCKVAGFRYSNVKAETAKRHLVRRLVEWKYFDVVEYSLHAGEFALGAWAAAGPERALPAMLAVVIVIHLIATVRR